MVIGVTLKNWEALNFAALWCRFQNLKIALGENQRPKNKN